MKEGSRLPQQSHRGLAKTSRGHEATWATAGSEEAGGCELCSELIEALLLKVSSTFSTIRTESESTCSLLRAPHAACRSAGQTPVRRSNRLWEHVDVHLFWLLFPRSQLSPASASTAAPTLQPWRTLRESSWSRLMTTVLLVWTATRSAPEVTDPWRIHLERPSTCVDGGHPSPFNLLWICPGQRAPGPWTFWTAGGQGQQLPFIPFISILHEWDKKVIIIIISPLFFAFCGLFSQQHRSEWASTGQRSPDLLSFKCLGHVTQISVQNCCSWSRYEVHNVMISRHQQASSSKYKDDDCDTSGWETIKPPKSDSCRRARMTMF